MTVVAAAQKRNLPVADARTVRTARRVRTVVDVSIVPVEVRVAYVPVHQQNNRMPMAVAANQKKL